MPDTTEIGNYLKTATAGANKKHQEKTLEAQKIENENLKLKLEMQKAQSQSQLDQAKTVTEAAKTEAEVRGIEQDNIAKKAQNIQMLAQNPGTPPPEYGGGETAKDIEKREAEEKKKIQFKDEELEAEPRPSPDLPKIDPPEPFLRDYFKSLEGLAKGHAQRYERINTLNRMQDAVREEYVNANAEYERKMSKNLATRRQLLQEIPTYKSAVGATNWLAKIVSVVDAGMLGHLRESPTYMLDQFVQKEYQDQMMQYKAKENFLEAEQNIYGKFYELNKDEMEAETSTLATLYKAAGDQVLSLAGIADTQGTKFQVMEAKSQLEHKQMIEEKKLDESLKQQGWKQFKEKSELKLKEIGKRIDIEKLQQTMKTAEYTKSEVLRKRSVEFGPLDDPVKFAFPTEKEASETRETIGNSGNSIRGARRIEAQVKELNTMRAGKAPFAILGGKEAKKSLALFNDINKGLAEIMLGRRIDMTGGGNMSQPEREWMMWFYGVTDGMTATQIAKQIGKKWSGQYDQIINMIKKASFNAMYNKLKKSRQFSKGLTQAEQFRLVAKELGIRENEIPIILKDHSAGLKRDL